MKKIFTLLLFAGITAVSFAQMADNQRRYDNGNEVAYNNSRTRDGNNRDKSYYHFSKREMMMQVAEINRIYERKIEKVKEDWFMSRYRKQRLIHELEGKRREEIKCVYEKFNDRHNRFDDQGPGKGW